MAEEEKAQQGLETELGGGAGIKHVTEKCEVKLTPKAWLEKNKHFRKGKKV